MRSFVATASVAFVVVAVTLVLGVEGQRGPPSSTEYGPWAPPLEASSSSSEVADGSNFTVTLDHHLAKAAHALGIASDDQLAIMKAAQLHRRKLIEIPCFDSCLDVLYFRKLTFCAMVDYNACPVGQSVEDAEIQAQLAYEKRINLEEYDPVDDCTNALRAFSCYTFFPKCNWDAVSYSTCQSSCENVFIACNVDQGSSCDGFEGVGPAPDCTGAASALFHRTLLVLTLAAGVVAAVAQSIM